MFIVSEVREPYEARAFPRELRFVHEPADVQYEPVESVVSMNLDGPKKRSVQLDVRDIGKSTIWSLDVRTKHRLHLFASEDEAPL